MTAYYNEIEPYPAAWLSRLVDAGHIAHGTVDARSIREVQPRDLDGYAQCHFFAGIGAWSYALRLAGVPDTAPVWTGSCPCQPFSAAGRRGGFSDDRHLWPEWFRLIRECRPAIIFGEQVASPDGLRWLDAVSADLEGEGYAVGAADLCAAGVIAPHLRQRLFFVAYAAGQRRTRERLLLWTEEARRDARALPETAGGGEVGGMALPDGGARGQGCANGGGSDPRSDALARAGSGSGRGALPWTAADWLPCLDGKSRPVEPGTFPLAHGAAARVGRLRAYGNAIVPQVAARFIQAAREAIGI